MVFRRLQAVLPRLMGSVVTRALFSAFLLIANVALEASPLLAEAAYGPYGPEGARMREQLWILPSGDPARPMRATVFQPVRLKQDVRRPVAVINHGTDEMTRLSVSMPVYYWLSRWFVDRGYVVVLPQRRGHGATGGELSESVGSCENADHYASGVIAANDIASAVDFMTQQPFAQSTNAVVVGISTGGWASLALAARNPPNVAAVVNFAGGRGGHAYGQDNEVCNRAGLQSAARLYGARSRTPTIWYYSENDTFFGPQLAESLSRGWRNAGGSVEAHFLAPYAMDGHTIADNRAGWDLWGATLEDFFRTVATRNPAGAKKNVMPPRPMVPMVVAASVATGAHQSTDKIKPTSAQEPATAALLPSTKELQRTTN